MQRAAKMLDNIVYVVAFAFLAFLFITVIGSVFYRYILGSPLIWVIETSRYCLVWLTFLGAYLGLRKGGSHISMSLIYDRFSPTVKWYVDLAINLAMLSFFIFVVRYGGEFAHATMHSRAESFDVAMGPIYSILPLSGLLFSFHCLVDIMRLVKVRNQGMGANSGT